MIRVILVSGEFFETKADAVVLAEEQALLERKGQQAGSFHRASIARIEFVDGFKSNMEKTQAKSPKAWARWTDEDDARLAERFGDGASIAELSEEFERTPGAVRSRLLKKGIVNEAWFILHAEKRPASQGAEDVGDAGSAKGEVDPWVDAPPPASPTVRATNHHARRCRATIHPQGGSSWCASRAR